MPAPALRLAALAALAALATFGDPRPGRAQEPAARKDDALDRLLEKLDTPKPAADPGKPADAKPDDPKKPAKPEPKPDSKPAPGPDPASKDEALEKLFEKLDQPKPTPDKPGDAAKPKPGEVGAPDQSLDKLLEGLGGADDKPAPDDKKQGGGQGPADQPPPPAGGDAEKKPDSLDNASKKLDDLLEEKTGRKPKKKPGQGKGQGQGGGGGGGGGQGQEEGEEDGGGPLGDLIKQMREVEDRLGKPDTGAETRKRQSEIVKNLDTLLEQVRNSSGQGQAMRMIRGQSKPGGQPKPGEGNQPGATGQGVGLARPTPPRTPPKPIELAKEVWGQLPDQFRDDMSNILNENPLPTKAELIRLYYLSLGKKSTKGD